LTRQDTAVDAKKSIDRFPKEDAMTALKPATELAAAASKPYPNDSDEYRRARTALLAEEVELRRHIERVAAQRRALPLGGEAHDYSFKDERGKTVRLADLFGRHDTLVTYFWMYGPERERPCPMCTSFIGSLDIPAKDIAQRIAIAVIGRSPVERQLAFARERGWKNLGFYATVGDDFARDYRGLAPDGSEWPALDVWVKRDGKVFHFWGAELGATSDPDQDPRGAPDPTPLWNILDLTPAGRGVDWYPKLDYPKAA
jgi:predicted dithiol-disulfide oxidoreductase (DUF899 family)